MAPECGPWCSWSRFNSGRSLEGYQNIQLKRETSLKHLRLCSAIMKIQTINGRHFHMENPLGSSMWNLKEVQSIVRHTIPVVFDQCRYGLRHPTDARYLRKATRVQTTSEELQFRLDGRFCKGEHSHAQIAGSCVFQGRTIRLSRFSAFYPAVLARTIGKSILSEQCPPSLQAICFHEEAYPANEEKEPVSGEHPEAPSPKRRRAEVKERKAENPEPSADQVEAEKGPLRDASNRAWDDMFNRLQSILPKSGTRTWSN